MIKKIITLTFITMFVFSCATANNEQPITSEEEIIKEIEEIEAIEVIEEIIPEEWVSPLGEAEADEYLTEIAVEPVFPESIPQEQPEQVPQTQPVQQEQVTQEQERQTQPVRPQEPVAREQQERQTQPRPQEPVAREQQERQTQPVHPQEPVAREQEPVIQEQAAQEQEQQQTEQQFRHLPTAPAVRHEPQNDEVVFSRTVSVTVGQILEIPFRGNGWVFLGELASRRGIAYNSRRNDPQGLSFIFNIEEAGTYALKFFREDFTRGYILNDYVQVIAGEAPAAGTGWFNPPYDRGRVIAQPRWPSAAEEAEIQRGGSSTPAQESSAQRTTPEEESSAAQRTTPAQESSAAQRTTPAQESAAQRTQETAREEPSVSPDLLLQRAKQTFDDGNTAAAISLLDQYMTHFPGGSDEVYWLYGQFYEANTPSRNILLSLEYYRRLANEFPQSSRLTDARRRIAYLERFYINIQ
ncbi:MAG: hypothetical protein FWD26_00310 [Treponema sp.]|nr:hypothetical protein [Treponema sp.]